MEHVCLTPRLCYSLGSSRWSPGLWWGPDSPGSPRWVKAVRTDPCYLGTPTISCIMNVMKNREIDALAMPWVNARVVHLLSACRATAMVVDDKTAETANLNGYDEVVFTRNMKTIDPFSSCFLPAKLEKAYTGECINVMTQVLWITDGSLPQGLTIQNAYTEFQKGSKNVVMVVRNSMAYPQMLWKKAPVARAVAATMVPETLPETGVWEGRRDLRTLIHLIWLLDKGKVSCLKN